MAFLGSNSNHPSSVRTKINLIQPILVDLQYLFTFPTYGTLVKKSHLRFFIRPVFIRHISLIECELTHSIIINVTVSYLPHVALDLSIIDVHSSYLLDKDQRSCKYLSIVAQTCCVHVVPHLSFFYFIPL